jgi:hypothetical protein
MWKARLQKVEALARRRIPRKTLVVYENDWRHDRPNPTPEELADPDARIIYIRYVADWRNPERCAELFRPPN